MVNSIQNTAKRIKVNSIFVVLSVLFFIAFCFSAYIRRPQDSYGFPTSDATYHVLLTMQALDETPQSVHHWLPIQTFADESNKWINNGTSLIQDKKGNSFYLSFSPMGFYAPYFFCKIFHLNLSIKGIYIFNSFLLMFSALLTGIIMYLLFKSQTVFWIAAFSYLFLPEMLYTQGIVYWHHSLAQVLLLLQTAFFISIFVLKKKSVVLYVFYVMTCFLYPYLEWTGYVSNAGMILGIMILGFHIETGANGRKKIVWNRTAFYLILSTVIATIGAVLYYLYRFSYLASFKQLVRELFLRAESREEAPIISLLSGYFESYSSILIAIALLLVVVLAISKSRKNFVSIIWTKKTCAILLVTCFPIIENFVLKQHAIVYTFDRLKASSIIIFIFCALVFSLLKVTYTTIFLPVIAIFVFMGFGLQQCKKKVYNMPEYADTILLRDYIQENFLSNKQGILIKDGWRAWGYLQTLYHKNIYCTVIYTQSDLIEKAKQNDYRYLVTLIVNSGTSGLYDTTCYTNAIVYDLQESQYSEIIVENGVIKHDLLTYSLFYLTDSNWEKGYYKQSGGIVVLNTQENREKYVLGGVILLPDGSRRKIIDLLEYRKYLFVFTEGDSFILDIFPHQLDVVEDWTTFYFTDSNWEKGYCRQSGGFVVMNTEENRKKYQPGCFVLLPDGSCQQIVNISEYRKDLFVFTDGKPFVLDVFPHQLDILEDWTAFYPADDGWEKGYYKKSGGIVVINSQENREKYRSGCFILLPDGSKRKIIRTKENKKYFDVFTEGDSFVLDVFPHQLDVIEDWKTFYLTDNRWEKGYSKKSGGFFVKKTPENRKKYQPDFYILLPDGSRRKIISTEENKKYIDVFTEGDSFVLNVFPHQLDVIDEWTPFYLTDNTLWEKGYYRSSGGFFVMNTPENREKYLPGCFILLPDGSKRQILRTEENSKYIDVFTEGDSFVLDVFPHQLDVIEDWTKFYLTDRLWEKGYYKKSGGFFVRNTQENREKFKPGCFILLPDGSRRKIIRIIENGKYLNVSTEGKSFVPDIFPHQLDVIEDLTTFYLDSRWEKGYYRSSGGFFVMNTPENREKYQAGFFVVLPDDSQRKIIRTEENNTYIDVFTEGDSFVLDVFPHQLDVIEELTTFYLSNNLWEKGYYRSSGGFFVMNTPENREKYQTGFLIRLPDVSRRRIIRIEENNKYLNVFTEGDPFVLDVFPHQLNVIEDWTMFYLTDSRWEKGFLKQSGGFFVKNTPENSRKYNPGCFILLPDGSRRWIIRTAENGKYIDVFTDGDSFVLDVFPHQLDVFQE